MKPKRKTKPALWTQVPGALPIVSPDRAEFSHWPVLSGTWSLERTAKAFIKACRAVKAKPRLKSVSTARAKQLREYAKLKREWLKSQDEGGGYFRCYNCLHFTKHIDVHHQRGRNGRLLCMKEFWIPLCRKCHNRVKDDPAWARSLKLLAPWGLYNSLPK